MLNMILAVVLLLVSTLVITYVAYLLVGSLHLLDLLEKKRVQRYIAHASRGDRYLERGRVRLALAQYRQSLYPYPARSRQVAELIRRHHIGLLSRLIAAADQVQGRDVRLISLARADRLFQDRDQVQSQYLSARAKGKRRREQERDFRHNTKELRNALCSLAAEIEAASKSERTH